MRRRSPSGTILAMALPVLLAGWLVAGVETPDVHPAKKPLRATPATPVKSSSPLDEGITRGLEWLVRHQHPNGGWSQGEESQAMRHGMEDVRDTPNVTDTAMAALALIRAGSTPSKGPYAENVRRAVEFVCHEIQQAPAEGLAISGVRGTRVQAKLGQHIDTFSAALLLAEVADLVPEGPNRTCAVAALEKITHKIVNNQQADGTWTKDGWAPTLSQGMAAKALNRAAQAGVTVDEKVREKAEDYARRQFDQVSAGFKGEGSAGVELYSAGASVQAMRESARTNEQMEEKIRDDLAKPSATPEERSRLQAKLALIEENRRVLGAAEMAVARKMEDPQFASGFGSNGGEEFLSYLSIGESLFERGGEEWRKWAASMSRNLERVQNQDGSWTGHHCITGRTFCTAAALMVLTIDRASQPVRQKLHG